MRSVSPHSLSSRPLYPARSLVMVSFPVLTHSQTLFYCNVCIFACVCAHVHIVHASVRKY